MGTATLETKEGEIFEVARGDGAIFRESFTFRHLFHRAILIDKARGKSHYVRPGETRPIHGIGTVTHQREAKVNEDSR